MTTQQSPVTLAASPVPHPSVLSRRALLLAAVSTLVTGANLVSACGGAGTAGGSATATSSVASTTATTAPATRVAATASTSPMAAKPATTQTTASAAAKKAPVATPTTGLVRTGAFGKAKVALQWYSYFNPQDIHRIGEQFLPQFEQTHPGIAVEAITAPNGNIIANRQKYLAMTSAGDPPDLFSSVRAAPTFARLGIFANLSPLIQRDKFDTAKYNQPLFTYQASYKGNIYGLPVSVHAEAPSMVYNRTLFQAAGVPEPPATWGDDQWTWNIFVDAARKLTKQASTTDLSQVGVDTLAYIMHLPVLWEGTWVSPQLTTATCDQPAMVDTYTSYYALSTKEHVMPWPGVKGPRGGFLGGKVAMSTIGSWQFGVYQKLDNVDWAFMPFPKAKRSAYVFDPNMDYIAHSSKHVDETWEFLKWLDAGSRYAIFFNFMPVIATDTAAWLKTYFARKPNIRVEVLQQSLEMALPTDPLWLIDGADTFVSATVLPALAKIGQGKAEVAATVQSIKGPLQHLVDGSGK